MKITEHEMRGLLAGKCLPGDMRVNEELPAYLVRKFETLQQKLDAVVAENAMLKNGIGFFSYGTDSGFEEHESAEKAIAAADSDIDYYRGDACDGWSEETDQTVWGVILQRATMIDEQPRTEELPYGSCDFALLPNISTPATDAILNAIRAEGAMIASQSISKAVNCFQSEHAGAVMECADIAREVGIGMAADAAKDGEK